MLVLAVLLSVVLVVVSLIVLVAVGGVEGVVLVSMVLVVGLVRAAVWVAERSGQRTPGNEGRTVKETRGLP